MKKNSLIDYTAYILFRVISPVIRLFPVQFNLFLGRRIGDAFYYCAPGHKSVAYANIKRALGNRLSPGEVSVLTRSFYQAFGQNIMEMFFIPLINPAYMRKYIRVEGSQNVQEALKKGRGVILLGVHAGSWELSNLICANLGFAFNLFVSEQKYSRLNNLLNSYRSQKGCKLIGRQNQLRELIGVLKSNEVIGMTFDQGGKAGVTVKFFDSNASMAQGAIKLALRYGAVILPAFYTRIHGPYVKTIIGEPFVVTKSGNEERDIQDNAQALGNIFEKHILSYPQEYLWTYKIWKYGLDRDIIILSDGKAGHLRQSEAVAKALRRLAHGIGMQVRLETIEIKFKSAFRKRIFALAALLSGKYNCQGCFRCARWFLSEESYEGLLRANPHFVISCGSSLAAVNFVLARQNCAKSIAVMKPGLLGFHRFDLIAIPRHDRPGRAKNIVVTEGALNLIDEEYLKEQSEKFVQAASLPKEGPYLGLLLGGDSKHFSLDAGRVRSLISQMKGVSEKLKLGLLVTTSRRSPAAVEKVVREELKGCPRAKAVIIANEKNIPEAVGGILALSKLVVVSPESISMISEAASCRKYVLVFDAPGLDKKHRSFLKYFIRRNYIYFEGVNSIGRRIEEIWMGEPPYSYLEDRLMIQEKLKVLL